MSIKQTTKYRLWPDDDVTDTPTEDMPAPNPPIDRRTRPTDEDQWANLTDEERERLDPGRQCMKDTGLE